MPVIRPAGRREPLATVREQLADLLVKELLGERSRRGPVIFELVTDQINMVDVIAVWEEWKRLPRDTRSEVVRDAYRRFASVLESGVHQIDKDKPSVQLVPTPLSVIAATWDDIVTDDLLPYQIVPRADDDVVDQEDVRLLMIEVGAIWTPIGYQLRLPTEEMAAELLKRLYDEMPEAQWKINKLPSAFELNG